MIMAGYQFFHVEAYAREESTKGRTQTKKNSDGTFSSKEVAKEKRGNVRWVIAEAKREQDSCHHIDSPQPPLVLLGDLDQVEQEATRWAEEATDERGRKLRKDGACLLAGVISLPRDEEAQWEKFKAKSLDWLKEKYGDNLRCVIAHEKDEAHPHLHFYAVPKDGQKFEDLHEGKRAQKELKKKNPQATKQEQNLAFANAMRATQDDFSKRVGQRFGLARLGPGRRRLTRSQWKAEQKQAEALAEVERTAKKRREHYKAQGLAQAKEQAEAEAQKFGSKVGAIFDGFKNSWHKPSKEIEEKAAATKAEAQAYADRIKQQAERAIKDERRQRQATERELEKQKNITANTEAENKRLQRELEDYRGTPSNRQGHKFKPT